MFCGQLGSPIHYLASHQLDVGRHSFSSFFSFLLFPFASAGIPGQEKSFRMGARASCLVLQASQVRKSPQAAGVGYNPDVHRSSTVHAGSWVQQVGPSAPHACCTAL